ncbi:hypothetical protein TNCV_2730851 [Trichonephila clavipes]|nr:hypothetical protein TNCV_2730851 [Trichonephila clavipes]
MQSALRTSGFQKKKCDVHYVETAHRDRNSGLPTWSRQQTGTASYQDGYLQLPSKMDTSMRAEQLSSNMHNAT